MITGGKQKKVMNYLLKGNTLTQKQAIARWEHYRLAVVVGRMKQMGYNVLTDLLKTKEGGTYARYRVEIKNA